MPLSVGQVSGWVASSICRGVASSEAEMACLPRVGPLPSSEEERWCTVEGLGGEVSSEAEIAPRVRGGPRMGRTAELGHRLSEDWASLGPGGDPGAVGELDGLHGIRV